MTKMVGDMGVGWGVNFWVSGNWSRQVHFEGPLPDWPNQMSNPAVDK